MSSNFENSLFPIISGLPEVFVLFVQTISDVSQTILMRKSCSGQIPLYNVWSSKASDDDFTRAAVKIKSRHRIAPHGAIPKRLWAVKETNYEF